MSTRPAFVKQMPRADVSGIIKTALNKAITTIDGSASADIVLPDSLTAPPDTFGSSMEGRAIVTAMKCRWNEHLPFHHLPIEVFVEILLDVDRRENTTQRNWNLTRVCKYWRSVVFGSTAFWTQIRFKDHFSWVRHTMLRCPTSGIRVICDPRYDDPPRDCWNTKTRSESRDLNHPVFFYETVDANVSSLRVCASLSNFRVQYIADMSAKSSLKELEIVTEDEDPIKLAPTCSIEHLAIQRASIRWNDVNFTRLRSLRLHGIKNFPSISKLHAILTECPLEWVALQNAPGFFNTLWGFLLAGPDDGLTMSPVVLPHLRSLIIMNVSPMVKRLFMHSIIAPKLRYICSEPLELEDFHSDSFLRLVQGPLAAAANVHDVIDVAYEDGDSCFRIGVKHRAGGGWSPLTNVWEAPRPGVELIVELRDLDDWHPLEHFISTQNGHLASVSFEGNSIFADPGRLSFLRQWSSITHLSLKYRCNTDVLLNYITTPYLSSDGNLALPLPHLQELGLYSQEDPKKISTLIEKRAGEVSVSPITKVWGSAKVSAYVQRLGLFGAVEVMETRGSIGRWASFPRLVIDDCRYP